MKMNKIQQLSSWSSQLSGEVRHMQIALYTIGDRGNTERSQKHLRSAMGSISLRTFQHEAGICTRLRQNWTVRSQLATYQLWGLRPVPQPLWPSVSLAIKWRQQLFLPQKVYLFPPLICSTTIYCVLDTVQVLENPAVMEGTFCVVRRDNEWGTQFPAQRKVQLNRCVPFTLVFSRAEPAPPHSQSLQSQLGEQLPP